MTGMKDTLGDVPYRPHGPGFKERGGTSEQAAKAVASKSSRLRDAVLYQISLSGQRGMTADEIAAALNASVLAVRPRVSELNKMAKIKKTTERRRNESGLYAAVWVTY